MADYTFNDKDDLKRFLGMHKNMPRSKTQMECRTVGCRGKHYLMDHKKQTWTNCNKCGRGASVKW